MKLEIRTRQSTGFLGGTIRATLASPQALYVDFMLVRRPFGRNYPIIDQYPSAGFVGGTRRVRTRACSSALLMKPSSCSRVCQPPAL